MTSGAAPLVLALLAPEDLVGRPAAWWDGVLGLTVFGGERPAGVPETVPLLTVDAPPLQAPPLCEAWLATAPLRSGTSGRLRYRLNDEMLFGAIELDEPAPEADKTALQVATERAYDETFALIDELGFPYLWRVWNYLPRINLHEQGSERYWQFNTGRQDAFRRGGRTVEGEVPAACALGTRAGPAVLYFIALREAPLAVENPRQVAAYRYPTRYGPHSPTFSRASLARPGGQAVLFVSGTASIVGHETRHIGDVTEQTRESLRNIEAVVEEASRRLPGTVFALRDLVYKVYVRHAQDLAAVRAVIDRHLDGAVVEYVLADVCRSDLLVEIEASGGHAVERRR